MTNNVLHEILSLNTEYGFVIVKYYTEEFKDGLVYQIDIPISSNGTNVASLVDLNNLIADMTPTEQINFAEKEYLARNARKSLCSTIDFSEILSTIKSN
jgi:hypothetical protein